MAQVKYISFSDNQLRSIYLNISKFAFYMQPLVKGRPLTNIKSRGLKNAMCEVARLTQCKNVKLTFISNSWYLILAYDGNSQLFF